MTNLTPAAGLLPGASRRAISLIEGVLYLVIGLAVIVGGIVFFQQAQLSTQITDSARALMNISSQTRGLYRNQRDFGTEELTAALVASGAVPSNAVDADGGIRLPTGSEIRVFGKGADFAVVIPDISLEVCQRLLPVSDSGEGLMGTGVQGVEINDYADPRDATTLQVMLANYTEAEYALPVTPNTVQSECQAIEDGGGLADVFVVYGR